MQCHSCLSGRRGRSPSWAVSLSRLLQDNSLVLRISVVAVVGESFLVPVKLKVTSHACKAKKTCKRIQSSCIPGLKLNCNSPSSCGPARMTACTLLSSTGTPRMCWLVWGPGTHCPF
ncbi:hypothetical protein QJQ45_024459 [Haematococcus lacustris]|nr:hypothetical protein QJQ45_024459 [Haematococcus lacustris]